MGSRMRTRQGRPVRWLHVGSGTFNVTRISKDPFEYKIDGIPYHQRWVLKKPKWLKDSNKKRVKKDNIDYLMNRAERAVRIWNELNPDCPAVICPEEDGWLAPYVDGGTPTDEMVAKKQIELYRKKRRIVADGCGPGNFLLKDGEPICVDVDQALHTCSPVSQKVHNELIFFGAAFSRTINEYWDDESFYMPRTVAVIKTLFYLESQLPQEEIDNRFITPDIIHALHRYRIYQWPITQQTLRNLLNHNEDEKSHQEVENLLFLNHCIPSSLICQDYYSKELLSKVSIFREQKKVLTVFDLVGHIAPLKEVMHRLGLEVKTKANEHYLFVLLYLNRQLRAQDIPYDKIDKACLSALASYYKKGLPVTPKILASCFRPHSPMRYRAKTTVVLAPALSIAVKPKQRQHPEVAPSNFFSWFTSSAASGLLAQREQRPQEKQPSFCQQLMSYLRVW